jgi:hypothetical protein
MKPNSFDKLIHVLAFGFIHSRFPDLHVLSFFCFVFEFEVFVDFDDGGFFAFLD